MGEMKAMMWEKIETVFHKKLSNFLIKWIEHQKFIEYFEQEWIVLILKKD